jgi:hypothetical protein
MTPYIVRNENDAEWLKQVESDRMSWCLADVVEMHGPAGLSPGYGLWGPTRSPAPVIYPDVDPHGENWQPLTPFEGSITPSDESLPPANLSAPKPTPATSSRAKPSARSAARHRSIRPSRRAPTRRRVACRACRCRSRRQTRHPSIRSPATCRRAFLADNRCGWSVRTTRRYSTHRQQRVPCLTVASCRRKRKSRRRTFSSPPSAAIQLRRPVLITPPITHLNRLGRPASFAYRHYSRTDSRPCIRSPFIA